MRFDRPRSSDSLLVMTLFHAVLQGYTEAHWQEEPTPLVHALRQHLPDPGMSHADEGNQDEQTIRRLKDLSHWPW